MNRKNIIHINTQIQSLSFIDAPATMFIPTTVFLTTGLPHYDHSAVIRPKADGVPLTLKDPSHRIGVFDILPKISDSSEKILMFALTLEDENVASLAGGKRAVVSHLRLVCSPASCAMNLSTIAEARKPWPRTFEACIQDERCRALHEHYVMMSHSRVGRLEGCANMSWIGLLEQPDCSVEFYSESDSPVLRLILVDQPGQSFGALLPAQSQGCNGTHLKNTRRTGFERNIFSETENGTPRRFTRHLYRKDHSYSADSVLVYFPSCATIPVIMFWLLSLVPDSSNPYLYGSNRGNPVGTKYPVGVYDSGYLRLSHACQRLLALRRIPDLTAKQPDVHEYG
ncbi:hypothetical protein BD769DRAFT_1636394 [Suillus cothurnatus]|nr:hypothetical protein BD769DRAFT_1636394 [Suillus cothurnatus]